MNPVHLRTFLAVRDHGSYTQAARALFLSQPAVSRQVHDLEDDLGVRLFDQIGKALFLTDAGRTLAAEAERLLGSIDRAVEAVRAHRGADRGLLRIGASTTPGFYLLPRVLGRFHARHPGVEISYAVDNSLGIEEGILRNGLDVGFVGAPLASRDILLEPFLDDRIVFFSSPAHPLARRRRIDLESLEDEWWVIREQGSATRRLVEEELARSGVKIGKAVTLSCPEAVKAVVAGGFGFSFLSIHGLRDDLKRRRLSMLSVRGFRLERTLYRARHRDKHASPAVEAFLEAARHSFGPGKKGVKAHA
jgi:DNA-binding transcriptional LysR family regulator